MKTTKFRFISSAAARLGQQANGPWQRLLLPFLAMLLIGSVAVGYIAVENIQAAHSPLENQEWAIYQLEREYLQLKNAVFGPGTESEVAVAAQLFLSRINLIRDGAGFQGIRNGVSDADFSWLLERGTSVVGLLNSKRPGKKAAFAHDEVMSAKSTDRIHEMTVKVSTIQRELALFTRARLESYYMSSLLFLAALITILMLSIALLVRAQNILGKETATLRAVLEASGSAIVGIDQSGAVRLWSDGAEKLFEVRANEIVSGIGEVGYGPKAKTARTIISLILKEGGSQGTISISKSLQGDLAVLKYSIRRSRKARKKGEEELTLVGIDDLTSIVRTEVEKEDLLRKLNDMARFHALGTVAAGIVHEIGQPLAAIRNYLFLLESKLSLRGVGSWRAVRELVARVSDEVDRLGNVLNMVRGLSPKAGGKLGSVDIRPLAAQAAEVVRAGFGGKPDIVVTSLKIPVLVFADAVAISQILINLIKNAVESTMLAKPSRIEVKCQATHSHACIDVIDFGVGVSEDIQATIFSPFRTTKLSGMGLGLSISKRLAEEHGGWIAWSNSPTGGATFSLLLPLATEREKK